MWQTFFKLFSRFTETYDFSLIIDRQQAILYASRGVYFNNFFSSTTIYNQQFQFNIDNVSVLSLYDSINHENIISVCTMVPGRNKSFSAEIFLITQHPTLINFNVYSQWQMRMDERISSRSPKRFSLKCIQIYRVNPPTPTRYVFQRFNKISRGTGELKARVIALLSFLKRALVNQL